MVKYTSYLMFLILGVFKDIEAATFFTAQFSTILFRNRKLNIYSITKIAFEFHKDVDATLDIEKTSVKGKRTAT